MWKIWDTVTLKMQKKIGERRKKEEKQELEAAVALRLPAV